MINIELQGKETTRKGFGEALVELGEKNPNIVVLGADISGSVMTSLFRDKFPDRFYSIGIAEQNATTIAVGMALSGKIPFFSSYSAFAAFRNADQIRVSVCYNNANVKIGGGHSGLTVGPDGATHQSLEEISLLRAMPNMTIVVPADYNQAKLATKAIAEFVGPAFIRFGRPSLPIFTPKDAKFRLGHADVLSEGNDVAIIACGTMVYPALVAAKKLYDENGIHARVVNMHTIKPIDVETIVDAAKSCGKIVTAEEHRREGGLFEAVAGVCAMNCPVRINSIDAGDKFGTSDEPDKILDHFGLNAESIAKSALDIIKA